jgi:hypothetical protein
MSVNVLQQAADRKKTLIRLLALLFLGTLVYSLIFFQEKIYTLLLRKGDKELVHLQFQRAKFLYEQASLLKPWGKEAKEKINLASKIQQDPYLGVDFFKEEQAASIVSILEKAKEDGSVDELLKNAQALLNSEMPTLATLPLEKAAKLAPERRDILHLLSQLYKLTDPQKEKELQEKLKKDPVYQALFAN